MDLKNESNASSLLGTYLHLFRWIAKNRISAEDLDLSVIHTHLITVLSTGILMWGYAFVAYVYMSSPIAGIVGFICSAIHLLSPLLFRVTNNKHLVTGVMFGAGLIHQATFSYFSGGFESDIIIWFGIIPMLAGLIAGRYSVIFWAGIVMTISTVYLVLEVDPNFNFPNLISPTGELVAHAMIAFGWIFLSLIIVYFYLLMRDLTLERLEQSSAKVNTLLRVLCHDLANLLQVVIQYSRLAKRTSEPGAIEKALAKIHEASSAMVDVIENVNHVYVTRSQTMESPLSEVPLKESLRHICSLLEDRLSLKQIEIETDVPECLKILGEETSFKHQVLQNILTNAIKFSYAGSKIDIKAREERDGRVSLTIQDYGVGMSEKVKKHLFDTNVISTTFGTHGEKGTGFGMGIMKSYVESYGGSVAVASEEGKGTTFTLELRQAKAS